MKDFISKNKKGLIVGVIIVLILTSYFIFKKQNTAPKKDQPSQAAWKDAVKPGSSTSSDVVSSLGEPQTRGEYQDYLVFNYNNNGLKQKDQIFLREDNVVLVKDKIDSIENSKIGNFKLKYGQPEGMLYGPYSEAGFNLYSYPSQGIAIVSTESPRVIMEIWYFEPMSMEEFTSSTAKEEGYSQDPPKEEQI